MTTPRDDQTILPIPVTLHRPLVECLDCKTPLTNSVSRRWGRGRRCRQGLHSAETPGRFTVEQDELPGA
ncbi:DUF6011 domain-containing protein [Streptomyces ipomoeae]|uniref:DUF6011 domain-containing protein n=1 Tax=Streptomyces ipomoeae TaxID=103232 RepID=UPI0011467E28|nr:DUF6011 domain-containing protein [Streptomyces ipomoeae]TQE33104.1 hypothetical protein Sipo7851_21640 [Streptomyces ipomoeae]